MTVILSVSSFSTAGAEETPLLRVLLKRLDVFRRIDLQLEGQYMLQGKNGSSILFSRGSSVAVELRGSGLVLFFSGASTSLGESAQLTRQDDGGDAPALRIRGASGLYPGDLSLTVSDGRIQPVLSLSLEDYLLGVVPNEMSDTFPSEALKAQAVCARTYALRKIGRSGAWDVVDTTNDQVFRGISRSDVNSAQAVSETAGLVITKDGKLAEGYYSASNGGQTELPGNIWSGTAGSGCYAMQDDPWDSANPDSLTRTVEIPRDASCLYRRFTALLSDAVHSDPVWKNCGFSNAENAFRIDGFSSIRVKTPRYAAPSRLMTELEVTLAVSGRKISGGTIGPFESAGTMTVTLQIFPDVMDALGLRVASSGNEIVTVEETDTGFILRSGRFGHGVGLSQRGAQWMASNDGMSFDEILAFYFPGSQLSRYTEKTPALSSASPELMKTPEPPAVSATPQPALMPVTEDELPEGAWIASVEKINDGSSLNLRSDPSPVASVIMRLNKHQRLIVLDEMDVPGWAHVKTDDAEGYVMSSYLEPAE